MSLEGQKLGPYRIQRLIGRGGMSDVYLATQPITDHLVAIKVSLDEDNFLNGYSFTKEGRLLAHLNHPHILQVYYLDEMNLDGKSYSYIIMEYCPEGSLADWLKLHRDSLVLFPHNAVCIVSQAAQALDYIHNRGILHLDIKPENFLVYLKDQECPYLKLTDFGIAQHTLPSHFYSNKLMPGTPTYMPPEQWKAKRLDSLTSASDQYALAVLAYELVAGRPPFQGSQVALEYQHIYEQPQPPSNFNPRLPKDIDTVLLIGLTKNPKERFASISAFARAFQQAVQAVDPPTIASARNVSNSSDIRMTLAISSAEALSGTSRTLTFPDGRQVTISIPPCTPNGQIVHLTGSAQPSSHGESKRKLILTITVLQEENIPTFKRDESKTIMSNLDEKA